MGEKQTSWFKTNVKFENSFKFWFALNWQNHNVQYFILLFPLLLGQFIFSDIVFGWIMEAFNDGVGTGIFVSAFYFVLPLVITTIIYKGFYQHFKDLKNGTSR